jgi:hypothetical protein
MEKTKKRIQTVKKIVVLRPLTAGVVLLPRGGRCILSAMEVVFASLSMAHFTERSQVFVYFWTCREYHARQMAVGFMAAFRSAGSRQDFETLPGIDPGLIIVRVAQFHRPLFVFHQQLSWTTRHRFGGAKT